MPSSFARASVIQVRKNLNRVSSDLEKLDKSSNEHNRKIRDLIRDVGNILERFDRLVDLLDIEEE